MLLRHGLAFTICSLCACLAIPVNATPVDVALKAVLDSVGRQTGQNVAIAFAYALPEFDAYLRWKVGANQTAAVLDSDAGPPFSITFPAATAFDLFFFQRWIGIKECNLEPNRLSEGSYFSATRCYKSGVFVQGDTGGGDQPFPPGVTVKDFPVDIKNLPLKEKLTIDMHLGTIGSLDALFGGGAQFEGGTWVPWDSHSETEANVRAYFDGSFPRDADSDVPSLLVPSVDAMFDADKASNAVDWFPYFLAAVQGAGTREEDGQLFYNDFTFTVTLTQEVPLTGTWYASTGLTAQGLASAGVPEPTTALLLLVGVLGVACTRRIGFMR